MVCFLFLDQEVKRKFLNGLRYLESLSTKNTYYVCFFVSSKNTKQTITTYNTASDQTQAQWQAQGVEVVIRASFRRKSANPHTQARALPFNLGRVASRSDVEHLQFSRTLLMSSDRWNRRHEAGTRNLVAGIEKAASLVESRIAICRSSAGSADVLATACASISIKRWGGGRWSGRGGRAGKGSGCSEAGGGKEESLQTHPTHFLASGSHGRAGRSSPGPIPSLALACTHSCPYPASN